MMTDVIKRRYTATYVGPHSKRWYQLSFYATDDADALRIAKFKRPKTKVISVRHTNTFGLNPKGD